MNSDIKTLGSGDLANRVISSGAALTVAKVLNRSLHLVRMMTIARWLGPEQMGVFAVATIVLAALNTFSETGFRQALIQKQGDITRFLLQVRTINALRGLIVGTLVFIFAPFMANFFHSHESTAILRTIALYPVITGFEPLFLILSQRDLRFGRVVRLQLFAAMVGLIVGILAAYFKPDAWALVWASLTTALVTTTGAHLLSSGRDLGFSFRFSQLRELRYYSFWVVISRQLIYLHTHGVDWLIGKLIGTTQLAFFQMASMYSILITREMGAVLGQLSFPVFSKLQDRRKQLLGAYSESFGMIALVTLFMATLVITCASDLFHLVLGEKWLDSLPLVPWMTIFGVCSMFNNPQGGVLRALYKIRTVSVLIIIALILFASGIFPAIKYFGILGAVIWMASVSITMQFVRYTVISRVLNISYLAVIKHVIVPLIACFGAIITTHLLMNMLSIDSYFPSLIITIIIASITYIGMVIIGGRWLEPSPLQLLSRARQIAAQMNLTFVGKFLAAFHINTGRSS